MAHPIPAAAPEPLTHRQVLVVFSGLLLAMLLAALDAARAELRDRGLIVPAPDGGGTHLTDAGGDVLDRLVEGRRAHLTEVLAGRG